MFIDKELNIPIYNWDVRVIIMTNNSKDRHIPDDILDSIPNKILDPLMDEFESNLSFGEHVYDTIMRSSLIIVSADKFKDAIYYNMLSHETDHLIDKIVNHLHINDTEARSYLTGYVYENYKNLNII